MTASFEGFRERLAPGIAEYLGRYDSLFTHAAAGATVDAQRAMFGAMCSAFARPRPPGLAVDEATVAAADHEIRVRAYRPPSRDALPGLLYFHGGGWMFGDLESHDDICAELAHRAGVAVIAVDYRRAPEHAFPAALDDGWAVLHEMHENAAAQGLDASRIGVCGDSSGGTLAAALCLRARDAGGPPVKAQILIYPALGIDFSLPSYRDNAQAPALTTDAMRSYWRAYLGREPAPDIGALAAPLLAADASGLPPALLLACELDPLRDDCIEQMRRLEAGGVPASLHIGRGLVHGAVRARAMSGEAARLFDAVCDGAGRLLRA